MLDHKAARSQVRRTTPDLMRGSAARPVRRNVDGVGRKRGGPRPRVTRYAIDPIGQPERGVPRSRPMADVPDLMDWLYGPLSGLEPDRGRFREWPQSSAFSACCPLSIRWAGNCRHQPSASGLPALLGWRGAGSPLGARASGALRKPVRLPHLGPRLSAARPIHLRWAGGLLLERRHRSAGLGPIPRSVHGGCLPIAGRTVPAPPRGVRRAAAYRVV